MTVRVLSTMDFAPGWLAEVGAISEEIEIEQVPADRAEELDPALLAAVEVLYTSSAFPAPEQAPRLRWIQLDTSGADHVRNTPVWSSEVVITSIAGVSPRPMAEYVLSMVLAFAHRLPRAVEGQRRREWPRTRDRWEHYRPVKVPGSRMTIVGYGSLGRGIARAAQAFGIEVLGVRRGGTARSYGEEVDGVRTVTAERLDEALAAADWVIVAVPGTPETMGLIGARQLAAMKPGGHLVNVARGGVVDETALVAALDAGHLAGAALDVFAQEPLPPGSPLWEHPRILVTPHVAGMAPEYELDVRRLFCENLARYLRGEPLRNVIDRELAY